MVYHLRFDFLSYLRELKDGVFLDESRCVLFLAISLIQGFLLFVLLSEIDSDEFIAC